MDELKHSGLPNKDVSPPGGWRCLMPETGQVFSGASSHQVINQLRASYKANGYPEPANYASMVEAYVCSKVPDYCTGNEPSYKPVEGFTFHTVLQGMRTITSWLWQSGLKGARQYAPQAQADKRAETCVGCSFNDEPQGCTSCNASSMKAAIRIVVGDKTTPFDAQLKACRVCQCDTKAKVHFPHKVLYDHMPDDQLAKLPAHCWMLTEKAADDAIDAAVTMHELHPVI